MKEKNDKSSEITKSNMDEAFSNASFADKLWLFSRKYYKQLTIAASTVLAIVIVVSIYLLHGASLESRMEKDFAALTDLNSRAKFAEKYSGTMLAGMVAIEVGDQNFKNCNFADARNFYEIAQKSNMSNEFFVRAKVYNALCMYKIGQKDAGEKILNDLLNDKSENASTRALAEFILVNLMIENGMIDEARDMSNAATQKDYQDAWNRIFERTAEKL